MMDNNDHTCTGSGMMSTNRLRAMTPAEWDEFVEEEKARDRKPMSRAEKRERQQQWNGNQRVHGITVKGRWYDPTGGTA